MISVVPGVQGNRASPCSKSCLSNQNVAPTRLTAYLIHSRFVRDTRRTSSNQNRRLPTQTARNVDTSRAYLAGILLVPSNTRHVIIRETIECCVRPEKWLGS